MHNALNRTLRGLVVVVIITAASIVMYSCYPNAPEDAEDFDVVATFYNETADFTAYSTFACRTDSIVQIQIPGADNIELSHQYDTTLLQQVIDNFTSRGYTRETNPQTNKPDMAVLVTAAATEEYDPYETDPWYDYWGKWFADSLNVNITWGLDYSWYSGSTVYSYDVGSLVIVLLDMTDVDNSTPKQDIPVLWMGSFNGSPVWVV